MKKHQTNPNLGTSFKITAGRLQKCQDPENKERLRNCSRFKATEEMSQLNLCDSRLDTDPDKRHCWDTV